MKTKIIKFSMFCIICGIAITHTNITPTKQNISDTLLTNIEALAAHEGDIGVQIWCVGAGSVYCPVNSKNIYKEVTYEQLQ